MTDDKTDQPPNDARFAVFFESHVWTIRVVAPRRGKAYVSMIVSPHPEPMEAEDEPAPKELVVNVTLANLRRELDDFNDDHPETLADSIIAKATESADEHPDETVIEGWQRQLVPWICAQRASAAGNL